MLTDVGQLKKGDILSETQYYTVVDVNENMVNVVNERGHQFSVGTGIVRDGIYSANQYTTTEKVNKTRMGEVLMEAGDAVFTVCYHKQIDPKKVVQTLWELNPCDYETYIEQVTPLLKGSERVLIGYLVKSEQHMGRSLVIDLEVKRDKAYRWVDHRTLKWLILKNVKYKVR